MIKNYFAAEYYAKKHRNCANFYGNPFFGKKTLHFCAAGGQIRPNKKMLFFRDLLDSGRCSIYNTKLKFDFKIKFRSIL